MIELWLLVFLLWRWLWFWRFGGKAAEESVGCEEAEEV